MLRYHLSSIFGRHAPQTRNMKYLREVSRPFYTNEMLEIMSSLVSPHMRLLCSPVENDGSATLSIGYKNAPGTQDMKFRLTCEWSDALQLCGREAAFRLEGGRKETGIFYFGETWDLGSNETQKSRKEYDTRKIIDFLRCAVLSQPCPSLPSPGR